MAFRAFIQTHVYTKQDTPKDKDKSSIQCLECYERNIYFGTKDSVVQHLILPSRANKDPGQGRAREGRARKLGASNPVTQLRTIAVFNQLLVLWDRSVFALNMFSLEPVAKLKKIQHVSLMEVCESVQSESLPPRVEMLTCSSRRKVVQIHAVAVDSWVVLREVALPQEPVAMAVDGTCLCIATGDRYLLCDYVSGECTELFPHNHSRQNIVACSAGGGEFLLNGPGSLGMFVVRAGSCCRPPLPWAQAVLAAAVCPPYTLALQGLVLCVYSMLDLRPKQELCVAGARGLLSAPDGVLLFTEGEIFSLSMVPLQEQIESLVGHDRLEEALLLLDGVQNHLPPDFYKGTRKTISCLAGFAQFYQEAFSEAKDLFIEGELDPRELISLYPDMRACLGPASYHCTQLGHPGPAGGDLQLALRQRHQQEEDSTATAAAFRRYRGFLADFLWAVRGTAHGQRCGAEVDAALLRVHAEEQGDAARLVQLVASANACRLDRCVPVLEEHGRFFALGLLYQNHGRHVDAIKTWVKMVDEQHEDSMCTDVYEHIILTLSQLKDRDIIWMFADWAVLKNPEIGVHIFIRRPTDDCDTLATEDVIRFLKKYPQAMLRYLEFLIHDLKTEETEHHNLLALTYVTQTLQGLPKLQESENDVVGTRVKLQQLLWDSAIYNVSTVYERVQSTSLHTEKAILLGRAGEHSEALRVLVHDLNDPRAAEAYCHRAAQGSSQVTQATLLLSLLHTYLSSEHLSSAAADLVNRNARLLAPHGAAVVGLLPQSWSVQLVSRFLAGSLRETVHQRRMGALQKGLAQTERLRHGAAWSQLASTTVLRLDKGGQVCQVCQRNFTEPQFVCNLKGEPMHISCVEPPRN